MVVNELSGATFTIRPTDETGTAVIPSNARYRLDDKTSLGALIAWTTLTPATTMTVSIPATSNAIIDASVAEEFKVFTVETDYGTSVAHVEELEYSVKNLQFVA